MKAVKPAFFNPEDSVKYDKERRYWFDMPDRLGLPLWEDVLVGEQLTQVCRDLPSLAYIDWIKTQMDQGLIPPIPFERILCNRCFRVQPLPYMAWCSRCAIKRNLRLRLEDDSNLDAIRANISLFKRLLKAAVPTPPAADADLGGTGYAELIEVYDEFVDEFVE